MTENGKVTIAPDEQGNVIRVSRNNPEFGHVRLTQEKVAFGAQGWVKKSTRSTLIHGKVEDLQAIGIADKTELAGQIVIREQLEAFSSDNPDRDLKIAGDTEIVCCKNGEPIYRKTFYSTDPDEGDTLVAHTNGDAIREANGAPARTTVSAEKLAELTNPTDDDSSTSRRKKKKKDDEEDNQVDLEDSIQEIEETQQEEVEVEDGSFKL